MAYFFVAIDLIIAAIYAVFAYVFMPAPPPDATGSAIAIARNWWRTDLLMWVATITIGVISLGSLYKIITLSKGGEAVAQMLGARPVPSANGPAGAAPVERGRGNLPGFRHTGATRVRA